MDCIRDVLAGVPQLDAANAVKNVIASTGLALFALMAKKLGESSEIHDDYVLRFAEYAMDSWRHHKGQPPIDVSRLTYLADYLKSESKLVSLTAIQAVFQVAQNTSFSTDVSFVKELLTPLAAVARKLRVAAPTYFKELAAEIGGSSRLRALASVPADAPASAVATHVPKFASAMHQVATFAICAYS